MAKTNVSVGDIIYFITGEPHKILDIIPTTEYPIKLESTLTNNNILYVSFEPNMYSIKPWLINDPSNTNVNVHCEYKELPRIKLDGFVQDKRGIGEIYHFSHFDEDGIMYVFKYGCDSITSLRKKSKVMIKQLQSYKILSPIDIKQITEYTTETV